MIPTKSGLSLHLDRLVNYIVYMFLLTYAMGLSTNVRKKIEEDKIENRKANYLDRQESDCADNG